MKDGAPRQLTSTLALRISLVIILLLVIPLIVHGVIIFVHDYRVKMEDATQFLHLAIEEGKKDFARHGRELYEQTLLIHDIEARGPIDFTALAQELGEGPFLLLDAHGECVAASDAGALHRVYPGLVAPFAGSHRLYYLAMEGAALYFVARLLPSFLAMEIKAEDLMALFLSNPRDAIIYETTLIGPHEQIIATSMEDEVGKAWVKVAEPLEESDVTLQLAFDKKVIAKRTEGAIIRSFEWFVILTAGGAIIAFFVALRIAHPLKRLVKTMLAVERGDTTARFQKDRFGFELNRIGTIFNETVDALLVQTQEKETLSKELILGGTTQQEILRPQLDAFPELQMATGFVSAKEVGGDFYDLHVLGKGRLLIVIADTSGKGLFASFFSFSLRGLLRGLGMHTPDLETLLIEANRLFCRDVQDSGVFVTAWVGIYDQKKGNLTYASAGHPPALILRHGELQELGMPGTAFGIEWESVAVQELTLQKEDLLFLYTDGITEAHDAKYQLFGPSRLKACLTGQDPNALASSVLNSVRTFTQGAAQHDDQTLIAVRVTAPLPKGEGAVTFPF